MKLTEQQVSYLKSLESKKKRRKFLLDCLVENLIGESNNFSIVVNKGEFDDYFKANLNKVINDVLGNSTIIDTRKLSDFPSTQINEHVKVFHTNTTAPRTFEGIQYPDLIKKKDELYSDELIKKLHEKCANSTLEEMFGKEELLKFDMLEDENILSMEKSINTIEFFKSLSKKLPERYFKEISFSKNNNIHINLEFMPNLIKSPNHIDIDIKNGMANISIKEAPQGLINYINSEVFKSEESANSGKKYTEEDMCIAFHKGRMTPKRIIKDGDFGTDKSFDDWFQEFKK